MNDSCLQIPLRVVNGLHDMWRSPVHPETTISRGACSRDRSQATHMNHPAWSCVTVDEVGQKDTTWWTIKKNSLTLNSSISNSYQTVNRFGVGEEGNL